MDHVKKQHYVPQFLLKNFSNDRGLIWYYDKHLKIIREKGAGGVAFEEYFYDKIPGVKEGSLEYTYQRAETHAAPIIQKIITQNTLSILTLDEKVALAMFIAMQLNRTKKALKNTERMQSEFWGPIKEFAKSTGAQLDSEPGPAKDFWLSTIENIPRYTEILLKKTWCLGCSNGEFYTSDHPVVKGNYKNRAMSEVRGVLGLDSDGIEIYFPLTPSLILSILCEKSYAQPNDPVQQFKAENILYVNHLQIKQSDRFIFASNGDFTLVEDVILKNEL